MDVPVVKAVSGQVSANENDIEKNDINNDKSKYFFFILIGI